MSFHTAVCSNLPRIKDLTVGGWSMFLYFVFVPSTLRPGALP
jgi:hypothetical protein